MGRCYQYSFLEDTQEIRFVVEGKKLDLFYSVKIKNKEEFNDVQKCLFANGSYDLTAYSTFISANGGKNFVCISRSKEDNNGHSK